MNEWLLVIAIFFPLAISPLFFLLERFKCQYLGLVSCLISSISLACVLELMRGRSDLDQILITIPWVPSLGINLSFIVDGLSLFFGILVAGMGVLVNFYAHFYMGREEKGLARFYCLLTCFMGVMLGAVFADNLMLLYFFWELTGLASYLLIGFYRENKEAVNNARLALLVTFLTGIFLFVGVLLIGILDGTYRWSEIIGLGINFTGHEFWGLPIMIFFLIAIFGKSAQLPLHFWLPRAMVAPIPVSAYLHAATMVKLGIFLTARVYPFFVDMEGWFYILTTVSFATMLFGAVLSLLANDLKELLAYATISQLGFFIGFYGMGGASGVQYDFVHIFNHALYKGSLFMLVGVITSATGIRDIRFLGGLWNRLPLTAFSFFLAAGAMAGIPGTTGFLSKELILGDFFDREWNIVVFYAFALLVSSLIFKVAFSLRLFFHLFVRRAGVRKFEVKKPRLLVQLPPLFLSLLAFLFGIWPAGLESLTDALFVSSLHLSQMDHLKVLHGWQYETLVSFGILGLGAFVFYLSEKSNLWWTQHKMFDWGGLWAKFFFGLPEIGKWATSWIHPQNFAVTLGWLFFCFVIALTGSFYSLPLNFNLLLFDGYRLTICALIVVSSGAAAFYTGRLSKLLALSISGFLITLYFVFFAAPDLAMTQILVEVATLLVLILVFSRFKKPHSPSCQSIGLRALLSVAVGLSAAWGAWVFNSRENSSRLFEFFTENSWHLAKGKNLVNTILIDFRGLDTLGETTVLVIVAFGILGLFSSAYPSRQKAVFIPSQILKVLIPIIALLVNVFALYLLFRGHNKPGGGFAGGLASGISVILIAITFGKTWRPLASGVLAALGLFAMGLVSLIPIFFGEAMMAHYIGDLPTPLIFDLGIYAAVLGITVAIYTNVRSEIIGGQSIAS